MAVDTLGSRTVNLSKMLLPEDYGRYELTLAGVYTWKPKDRLDVQASSQDVQIKITDKAGDAALRAAVKVLTDALDAALVTKSGNTHETGDIGRGR